MHWFYNRALGSVALEVVLLGQLAVTRLSEEDLLPAMLTEQQLPRERQGFREGGSKGERNKEKEIERKRESGREREGEQEHHGIVSLPDF